MTRLSALAALALVSALATPVVVGATGLSPKQQAVSVERAAPAPLQVASAAPASEAACARKIRVVYPGAGVMNGVACAPVMVELRR